LPAEAGPFVKWWPGASEYLAGRGAAPAGLWTSRLPDDALRCVCEHLAPVQSSANFAVQDLVDESQEYCDDVIPDSVDDLRRLNAEALDEVAGTLDNYSNQLMSCIGAEDKRVRAAKELKLVCSRWRLALKKSAFCLNARSKEYIEHADMILSTAHTAREVRLAVHGDPNDHGG